VIDAPGLGEDLDRDPEYLEMYRQHLPACDVILWVLAARNRAMALDQSYLSKLNKLHGRIVFALNQVDLIEPMDWNEKINQPSGTQLENMAIIVADREEKLSQVVRAKTKVEPYSAKRGYRLEELFLKIVTTTTPQRRWVLDNLKNFDFREFIPAALLAQIEKEEKRAR
jgi:predicted GTPase